MQILVVEDDEPLRVLLCEALIGDSHEAVGAATAREGIDLLAARLFDVVLLDVHLPDANGLDVLGQLRGKDPGLDIVMMTGRPDVRSAVEALKQGAEDYLSKPVEMAELFHLLSRIAERRLLRHEVRALRNRLGEQLAGEELVGTSASMRAVKETIAQVAPTDTTVLIEGETGTGKELVAAALHRQSPRRERAFIPVNCGAIPADLVESELFGHVRGAFSGAVSDSPGLFRSAHGGTLFLDEVAELPLGLQVKLLRVLQAREVWPVGAAKGYAVDVRVVAASNRPLDEDVRAGRFRSDLFYRLNVVRLVIPPLRDRREDIPPLASHILRRLNERFHRDVHGLTREALAALLTYDFPGNVRELEHLLERAYALGARDEIRLEDLPTLVPPKIQEPPGTGRGPLATAEREAIREALAQHSDDKEATARALGISVRTLYRRLKEFDLLGG